MNMKVITSHERTISETPIKKILYREDAIKMLRIIC